MLKVVGHGCNMVLGAISKLIMKFFGQSSNDFQHVLIYNYGG